jgi:predicted kinase
MIDGEPVLFDAIEFDDAIATSDILYDLAFLIMDLCHRGLHRDANHLLNRYLLTCEDRLLQLEGLWALPLFMSLRAAVRAKVLAAQILLDASKASERWVALAYFETAKALLHHVPPQLIAIGGISGTGKSTLAAAIASSVGRQPGAIHVRSDVERKKHFGVAETTRLTAAGYSREVTKNIYRQVNEVAEIALRAGQSVIVDATYLEFEQRTAVEAVASRVGAPFLGIWLEASMETTLQRVVQRRADASDATGDVVSAQANTLPGTLAWHKLDTDGNLEGVRGKMLALVRRANLLSVN